MTATLLAGLIGLPIAVLIAATRRVPLWAILAFVVLSIFVLVRGASLGLGAPLLLVPLVGVGLAAGGLFRTLIPAIVWAVVLLVLLLAWRTPEARSLWEPLVPAIGDALDTLIVMAGRLLDFALDAFSSDTAHRASGALTSNPSK